MSVTYKARNHPQTSETIHRPTKLRTTQPNHIQNIHKPTKPPTDHQQTSQTTHKQAKYRTNHPLISQESHRFFPEEIFYEPQHFPSPSRARREMDAFSYVLARFHISLSPFHNSLPSLIPDQNPSNKLLTQLQTLTNFSRRLGLTMLHWKFYGSQHPK